MHVWVPYADVLPQLPAALTVEVYDGLGEPPGDPGGVDFYVAPYTFDPPPLELMAHMSALSVVQTLTAGYEHVLPYLPEGVKLCNAGGLHDASTAELAITLILSSLRGIPDFVRAQERHEWRHERYPALADRTVLIVGYGGVGAAVERRLTGFEVTIQRVGRRERPGVLPATRLPELLSQADVVVLCVPLNEQTRGLVDADFLARMRDGALLVNVSRGQVVDTKALLDEVSRGRLSAAVDVLDPEPPPADHPAWDTPGLLLSPHVGGDSSAFPPRAQQLIVAQLQRYAAGEPLLYQVDPGRGGV